MMLSYRFLAIPDFATLQASSMSGFEVDDLRSDMVVSVRHTLSFAIRAVIRSLLGKSSQSVSSCLVRFTVKFFSELFRFNHDVYGCIGWDR